MRDYDPEANKEVGASPKSSNPPTADSQAGDELVHIFADAMTEYFDLIEGAPMNGKPYIDAKKAIQAKAIKRMAAYAERRATEARIDENRTYWWHQQKAAEKEGISKHALDRISALTKEIQQ